MTHEELIAEALRSQASEDSLLKRVEELEDEMDTLARIADGTCVWRIAEPLVTIAERARKALGGAGGSNE
jgi:hypothetical protein